MKLLFDLLPVILFFVTFKVAGVVSTAVAGARRDRRSAGWSAMARCPPDQAPILLATAVAIIASMVQVGSVLARGRRVDPMLWVSLGVIVVFGGATIWFHDETFIKWKPSILYWLFGASLLAGHLVWKKNLLHSPCSAPSSTSRRPCGIACCGPGSCFFALMGIVNLVVAYSVPTDTWVNFKLFGLFGLTLVFTLGIGIYLSRHMKEAPDA